MQEKLEKRLVFKACGLHSLLVFSDLFGHLDLLNLSNDLDLLSLYEPLLDMGTFTPFWTFRWLKLLCIKISFPCHSYKYIRKGKYMYFFQFS